MATNPPAIIRDILKDNWKKENTNNIIPEVLIITQTKKVDFNKNQDWILIHRPFPGTVPAGVGTQSKHVSHEIKVDLRVRGSDQESHFWEVLEEVERIFDSKICNPHDGYDILDPDSEAQDLSNKTFNIFRFVKPIKLIDYNKTR